MLFFVHPGNEFFKVAGAELLGRQNPAQAGEFEYGSEHRGKKSVAVEHMVVKNHVLQGSAFRCHDHNPMHGIHGSDGALRSGFEHKRVHRTGTDAYAAPYAARFVQHGLFILPVVRFHFNGLNRAFAHTFSAPHADGRREPGNEIRVDGLGQPEAFYGKKSFTAAAATVADKVDVFTRVFSELHQIVLIVTNCPMISLSLI